MVATTEEKAVKSVQDLLEEAWRKQSVQSNQPISKPAGKPSKPAPKTGGLQETGQKKGPLLSSNRASFCCMASWRPTWLSALKGVCRTRLPDLTGAGHFSG
jgi:hypothetical protein